MRTSIAHCRIRFKALGAFSSAPSISHVKHNELEHCTLPGLSSDLKSSFRYAKKVVAPFQVFSLINQDGSLRSVESSLPQLNADEWRRLYTHMIRLNVMDEVFLASQRQGRISFYMASTGLLYSAC